ncbi:MAG TPA: hypothetical protein VK588_06695, partial [Chitinophagaceae bacterium]|nr:hypothetical protein [Chitinophagaceae bacterium]
AYLSNDGDFKTTSIKYFDENSYNENVQLFAAIKPFKNISAVSDEYSSYFEGIYSENVLTNFLDDKGAKYFINGPSSKSLLSRIMPIEYIDGDPTSIDFFFTPQAGEKLVLNSTNPSPFCLVGHNGVEAIQNKATANTVEMIFVEDERILINKNGVKDGDGTSAEDFLRKNGTSRTTIINTQNAFYYLDSEKSPLFKNDKTQSGYAFINKADITAPLSFPIIPIFSFKANPELIEVEEVFKKVRLERIINQQTNQKLASPANPFITPQGFLKTGAGYDFIKNNPPPKRAKKNKKFWESSGTFQFRISDSAGDLDLSLRKDQVFFVLTPALFHHYITSPNVRATCDAFFSLNNDINAEVNFNVDITSLYNNQTLYTHDKGIIIFKFGRGKIFDKTGASPDLVNNTRLWTNHGLLNSDLDNIQAAIKNAAQFSESYFDDIINDENWNGIIALNIPVGNTIPAIFQGLASSQNTDPTKNDGSDKLKLKTSLNLNYAAFPVNKTKIDGGIVSITSTSFYGMIDYNVLNCADDRNLIINTYFKNTTWQFALTKLKVIFANSSITEFSSFAFLQIPELFSDMVQFDNIRLTHDDNPLPIPSDKGIPNLIRLAGSYQKNTSTNAGEFRFDAKLNGKINFTDNNILKEIDVKAVGFTHSLSDNKFRFDIDAMVYFTKYIDNIGNIFSFNADGLEFQNIGLIFGLVDINIPKLDFDFSRLLVIPNFSFTGDGFMSSFPITFSHFQTFKLPKITVGGQPHFGDPDFDFFKIRYIEPHGNIVWSDFDFANLYSFIFNFDLGTLGNLDGLKALKGQILIGWSFKGGFSLGFKLAGPGSKGLHLDLFGAVKLDIEEVDICSFKSTVDSKDITTYYLKLINARLNIFGVDFPSKDKESDFYFDFNGIIYAS